MDNPETLATFGTQNTGRRQTKQKTQHATKNVKNIIEQNEQHKTGCELKRYRQQKTNTQHIKQGANSRDSDNRKQIHNT